VPSECQCEPGQTPPVADAGLGHVICQGATVQIGTPQLAGHSYSWSPETSPSQTSRRRRPRPIPSPPPQTVARSKTR
jgi:hypothetical protein